MSNFDIIIVGGGIIGLATACSLGAYRKGNSPLNIALVDANESLFKELMPTPSLRASAINYSSRCYFSELGIWDSLLSSQRVLNFNSIHVREKNGISNLDANASSYQSSSLGYIIENQLIQNKLYRQANEMSNITFFCAKMKDFCLTDNHVFVELDNSKQLVAELIIGADGANSWLRQTAGFQMVSNPYRHHALITTVETSFAHEYCARQLFYPDGIVAFLPLWQQNLSCLVWSTKPETAKRLASVDEQVFNNEVTSMTERWVGDCKVINERKVFPLIARYCPSSVKNRIVLIGDAAHTIHPLAGQGANLGLRDSQMLALKIKALASEGKDFGLKTNLTSYQLSRQKDVLAMLAGMQLIQNMYDGDSKVKKLIRGFGMNVINSTPLVKKQLIKYAMGL